MANIGFKPRQFGGAKFFSKILKKGIDNIILEMYNIGVERARDKSKEEKTMMYNGRNLNQRKELFQRIQALESQRRVEIESIPDSVSDDEYFEACDRIDCKYNTRPLALKMLALEYPTSRNEWFKQFVESFGICESRRITRKQGEIFAKYSEMAHEHKSGRGAEYYVNVGNLFIKTTLFSQHEPAYVTIRAV